MIRLLIITFLVFLVCSLISAIDWTNVDGHNLYTVDKSDCVFPFTYQGVPYHDCTTDGDINTLPWCSLTPDFIGRAGLCYDFRKTSIPCVFPFKLNGKSFSQCSYLTTTSLYKQCGTNNSAIPYRYCTDAHFSATKPPLTHLSTCNKTYTNLATDHTECFGPSLFAVNITLNATVKQQILDVHNSYRAENSSRYMFKLYWDDELANMAQAHASLCIFEHDLAANRYSPKYGWKNGQNIVFASEVRSTIASLLDQMLSEEQQNFVYGVGCSPDPGTCLHYSQAMISNMTTVGCADVHCVYPDRIDRIVTCNYIQSQYSDSYMTPWIPSSVPGIDCGVKTSNGLCDCKNITCSYGVDPKTCKCVADTSKRSIEKRHANGEELMQSEAENVHSVARRDLEIKPVKKRYHRSLTAEEIAQLPADDQELIKHESHNVYSSAGKHTELTSVHKRHLKVNKSKPRKSKRALKTNNAKHKHTPKH